MISEYV
jgi:hypothetical protein